jgi:hypothetical protein
MKQQREFIVAEVVILSHEDGGRKHPLPATAYEGQYRPHIVLQSREIREAKIELKNGLKHLVEKYLGVAFWKGPDPIPISKPFELTLLLMYAPNAAYDGVILGIEFTIREGSKVVGHGRAINRSKENSA